MNILLPISNLKSILSLPFSKGLKRYSGVYNGGVASYYYYESEHGRIYHGRFSFSKKYVEPPAGQVKQTASGDFNSGNKSGQWSYTKHRHGESSALYVSYVNGVPDGDFSFKAKIHNGSVRMRSGKSIVKGFLRNGVPVGKITGMINGGVLDGYCDENGCPDGTWKFDASAGGSCRVNYEVWQHGRKTDAWYMDLSTGERHRPKMHIVEFLSNYLYNECLSLTKIMPKGSYEWNGNFNIKQK